MDTPPASNDFRPELLSVREREVLDLAVDGRTDAQIALALDLSTSTVNSYWVRIRGKLGQLSRTELVAAVLKHGSDLRYADLIVENARLAASERSTQSFLAEAQAALRAASGEPWPLLALSHAADAMLLCRPPGTVLYANLQAERLFDAQPKGLEGLMAWDLAIPESQHLKRLTATNIFDAGGPPRVMVGVESPLYSLRRDGENFRSVLVAERFIAPEGAMAVLTIREYMGEAEAILKVLRQPYKAL